MYDPRETPCLQPSALVELELDTNPTLSDALGGTSTTLGPKDRRSLTVIAGEGVGTLIPLGTSEVVFGRDKRFVTLMDPALSRRHARFFCVDHEAYVEDLGSTNGTLVRGARIHTPVRLDDGDHVQIGDHLLRFSLYSAEEEEAAIQLYETSVRDVASGAFNRRYFDARLENEQAAAARDREPLALLLVDIDGFKQVNDTHGHVVGDAVLRVVVASMGRLSKPEDLVARYGGDELVMLSPHTSIRNALILAERIRSTIERLPFTARENEFHVTVSVGVAATPEAVANGASLVEAADRALYQAKLQGRNHVSGMMRASASGHHLRAG
jgi:two-component system, cell cycle response regulator